MFVSPPYSSIVSLLLLPPARCLLSLIPSRIAKRLNFRPKNNNHNSNLIVQTSRLSNIRNYCRMEDEIPQVQWEPSANSIRFFLFKNAATTTTTTTSAAAADTTNNMETSTHTFLTHLSKQQIISKSNISTYEQSNDWIQSLSGSMSHQDLVLHVDESIIVCNKPSGLLCVPGLYHRELNLLQYVYTTLGLSEEDVEKQEEEEEEDGDDDEHRIRFKSQKNTTMTMENMVVHRLDMDTSGLVVYARNRQALLHLHAAFRASTTNSHLDASSTATRNTHKTYNRKEVRRQQRRKRQCMREQQQQQQHDNATTTNTTATTTNTNTMADNSEDDDNDTGQEFVEKGIKKTYEALLCGHFLKDLHHQQSSLPLPLPSGEIDFPLQRDHRYPPFMRVATPKSELEAKQVAEGLIHAGWKKKVRKNAKPSKTLFRILSWEYWNQQPVTRIQLTPWTGRTHQLRVHCAAVGHPIVGDTAYGIDGDAAPLGGLVRQETNPSHEDSSSSSSSSYYMCQAMDETTRQIQNLLTIPSKQVQRLIHTKVQEVGQVMCLHARDLTLQHPRSKQVLSFTAPPKF